MVGGKILLVDDNSVNRAILKKILGSAYSFLEAENGAEALDIINSECSDVVAVFLDIIMPVMDGYAFLTERKKSPMLSAIPVIAMTQNENFKSELEALSLGATDFILKPYEPTVVRQRLANILLLSENAALKNNAERDNLTHAYNKVTFYKKAYELIHSGSGTDYDIVYVNIEQFKLINDLFGASEGDSLLLYVAGMLRHCAYDFGGICGRLHSDNFAMCVRRQKDYQKDMVERNYEIIKKYKIDFKLVLRYGVYQIDDYDVAVNVMCDRANLALKLVKGKFDKYVSYYDSSLRSKLLEEQCITREMKNALETGQFVPYYQPKYDLVTEEIIGAEALARWIHPSKGIIPPDKFIPLFERNGFITYLDCYIWEEACKEIRRWIDMGHEPLPISVNLSLVDVYNPLLCSVLNGLTRKYNIDPGLLELEITESAYTESAEQLICTVKKLKSMGYTVGMDDFGSGYSSLNMLNELPIDVLKLDMRFMKNANRTNKESSGNILNFVMGLSKWMDIPVIAEGIETKEQGMFLRGMGCSKGQGYYFSKPLPREQFEELLGKSQASGDKKKVRSISAFVDLAEMWDSDSSFNAIFNGCVGALAIYEFMGDTLAFVRGNDRYYEMLGLKRDEIFSVAKNIIDRIHCDDREAFLQALRDARDGGVGFEIENRWYHPNSGQLRWYHRELKVIHRADERTIFLGSMFDITPKKELAESLMRQKNFYEDLVNTVPCGIIRFSCDSELRVLRVNKAAAKLLGFAPSDFKKKPRFYGDYIENSCPGLKQKMLDTLAKMKPGEIATMKYSIVSEKGELVWLHDAFQIVYDENGNTCGRSVIVDINDVQGQ